MQEKPTTLLQRAGVSPTAPNLDDAVLVFIDFQKEYENGGLPLPNFAQAVSNASDLLAHCRAHGTPVFHVVHHGKPGGQLFDPESPNSEIIEALAPKDGEAVVRKGLPNAFANTDLAEQIRATGRNHLIVAGFMTHMCVSSTVRAALDLGLANTVAGDACATRDLPDALADGPDGGGTISAETLHKAGLAGLADRFAQVFTTAKLIAEAS